MAGLTRSLITRHALGRADAYDAALLEGLPHGADPFGFGVLGAS